MSPHRVLRREFLRNTVAAGAMLSMGTGRGMAGQATNLERRQAAGLKLCCSSLAFSDRTWEEALVDVRTLGFRYADLAMCEGWAHVSPSALQDPEGHGKKIATTCARLEVEPVAVHANFALGNRDQFPGLTVSDPAARKTILAHFERVVSCTRTAEIPLVIVQPGKFIANVPRETCLKSAIDLLTQMHAIAARRGLMLAIENHTGSIAQEPKDTQAILEAVPGLRLDYGISHVAANSISLDQTLPLMKQVAHVAVRNAKPGRHSEPLENGMLSFAIRPFLAALREKKVNAYVSVEYLQPEMRGNIGTLKAILEAEGIPAR